MNARFKAHSGDTLHIERGHGVVSVRRFKSRTVHRLALQEVIDLVEARAVRLQLDREGMTVPLARRRGSR